MESLDDTVELDGEENFEQGLLDYESPDLIPAPEAANDHSITFSVDDKKEAVKAALAYLEEDTQ